MHWPNSGPTPIHPGRHGQVEQHQPVEDRSPALDAVPARHLQPVQQPVGAVGAKQLALAVPTNADSAARADEIALLYFTSGTTAKPKPVCQPSCCIRFLPESW